MNNNNNTPIIDGLINELKTKGVSVGVHEYNTTSINNNRPKKLRRPRKANNVAPAEVTLENKYYTREIHEVKKNWTDFGTYVKARLTVSYNGDTFTRAFQFPTNEAWLVAKMLGYFSE